MGGALDERTSTDAEPAAVREGPADLLLERLEQPRRDDEDERPQDVQRRIVGGRQLLGGEDLEDVRGQAEDDHPGADRVGALRNRELLGGADQPLYALSHEHGRLLPSTASPVSGSNLAACGSLCGPNLYTSLCTSPCEREHTDVPHPRRAHRRADPGGLHRPGARHPLTRPPR